MTGHVNDNAVKKVRRNFEIGRILHFKSEIRNLELNYKLSTIYVQFKISDFGSEMQDSSNFEIFGIALSAVIPLTPFPLPASMAARRPFSHAFRAGGGDCAASSWVPMSREQEHELSEEHPEPESRSFRPCQARAVLRNPNNRVFLSRSCVRRHIARPAG